MLSLAAFCDMHFNPGDRFKNRPAGYNRVVANGDIFNLIPWGRKIWKEKGQQTIEDVASIPNLILVEGNHDPEEWLIELFQDYPQVMIMSKYEFSVGERIYRFVHGHQFAPDWKILSKYADDITKFMTRFHWLRKLWYQFCISRGWMPGQLQNKSKSLIEKITFQDPQKKYEALIGLVHERAIADADNYDKPCHLFYGHTHRSEETVTAQGNIVTNMNNGQLYELEI